jgi:DDE superfamily endonuclease
MLVVCDDQCRITYYHVGWPGSVHDNRVWQTCKLFKNCNQYFSPKEYLLGDSAFTASFIMIPPFKANAGQFLLSNQSPFNTLLSKPRVTSEHCIGRLKGRLPLLKDIPMVLANKRHMDRIIDTVRGAVVLHNFLIEEPIEADWIDDVDNTDDLEPERLGGGSNQSEHKRKHELLY